jgi:mannose-6-phosphate isomerase-like protein (cupin superfamily)
MEKPMIVKNFFEVAYQTKSSHGGKGLVKDARVFDEQDFETALRFVIYNALQPGSSIGVHPHGEDEEVYVILSGEGLMTVNDETRAVKTGDVIVNKPGWSHGLENTSDQPLEILVFEVAKR